MPPVTVFCSSVGRLLKETMTFFPWEKLSTSYKSHEARQPNDWGHGTNEGSSVFLNQGSGEVFSMDSAERFGIAGDARFHQLQTCKARSVNTHL